MTVGSGQAVWRLRSLGNNTRHGRWIYTFAPAVESGDDVLDEIEDVVGGGFGRGLGGGADGVVVGDGEDDGSLSKAGTVCGHGVVDVVEVDEAAGPFDWGLREVELRPVLVDVLKGRHEGGEAGLDGEKNLFHI